jgi:PAS domain S-box-containing protein
LANDAPVMIWVTGVDGGCTWLNRPWVEFSGRPLDEHLGDGWLRDVHPDDADRFGGAYQYAFASREPFEAEMRLRRADGRWRWMLTRGSPRTREDGTFAGFVGTCTDITDRRSVESLIRLLADVGEIVTRSLDMTATLQQVARLAVPELADLCTIGVVRPDGRIERVAIAHTDPAAEERLRDLSAAHPLARDGGSALAEVVRTGVPLYRPLVDAPGPDEPWPVVSAPHDDRSLIVSPMVSHRGVLGALALVAWSRRYTPDDVALAQEVAHRCAAAVENAWLYRESEDARERLGLLARIGEQLASTVDMDDVARRVLDRVVPVVADFCVIATADRGVYRRFDVRHVDPGIESAFRKEYVGTTLDLDSPVPLARTIRTAEPVIIENLPAPRHKRDDPFEPVRTLGATSLVAVPLAVNRSVIGAIAFGYGPSQRRYNANDIPLVLDIARRVALALERAQQFLAERRTAETLQRSLLPDELPDLPAVTLRARYLPGGRAEVGGDWYDVVPLSEGRLGVVIGDVAGHGVRAAAVMGQLRNALRAFAGEGYAPAAMVQRLNRFVFENGPSDMATMCFAVIDPADGSVVAVSAGHPPVLLIPEHDPPRWLNGVGGPPVGVDPRAQYRVIESTLQPGDTLVLYTDGLIERRRESLDVGLQRLADAGAQVPFPAELDHVVDHLTTTLLADGGGDDDVAVLAVRFLGAVPQVFRWRRPARATELAPLRRGLTRWLESVDVPSSDVMVITVAASEAATNAIEHAYERKEGWVEIEANREGDDVVIAVRDGGRWRPKARGGGGRGLGLIGRLMDEFELRRSDQGTEVWMRRAAPGRSPR